MRGAKVIFVADACHGGGMVRDIDPRAAEMSFRQVPTYTLTVDELKPVSAQDDPRSELDLDRTAFLAAVDRNTMSPEIRVPGVDGLRGALSYAVARAFEGNADADQDGKVTLKELFANVRQVVYQLSDQRQNVVTTTSPNLPPDTAVAFTLTRGVTLIQGAGQASQPALSQPSLPQPSSPQLAASDSPATSAAVPGASSGANVRIAEQKSAPIRLAALDGKTDYFPGLKPRDTTFQAVRPTDNPDLIWDPASHDVIAWGDVIAYGVGLADLVQRHRQDGRDPRAQEHVDPVAPGDARLAGRSSASRPSDRRYRSVRGAGASGGVVQRFRRWHRSDALPEGPRRAVGPNGQSADPAACA